MCVWMCYESLLAYLELHGALLLEKRAALAEMAIRRQQLQHLLGTACVGQSELRCNLAVVISLVELKSVESWNSFCSRIHKFWALGGLSCVSSTGCEMAACTKGIRAGRRLPNKLGKASTSCAQIPQKPYTIIIKWHQCQVCSSNRFHNHCDINQNIFKS